MADFQKEREKMIKTEEEITSKITDGLNEMITILFFISRSEDGIREKRAQVRRAVDKARRALVTFAQSKINRAYKDQVRDAYKLIGQAPKKLNQGQLKEMKAFSATIEQQIDDVIDKYQSIANRVILQNERQKIRENFLKYEDGSERKAVSSASSKLAKDFDFRDSKGRRIKSDAVVKITAGDTTWSTIVAARNSVFLLSGFNYGYHRSVIDDRTSEICKELDGKIRDLRKDQLPPMHPNCRSVIEPILDPDFKP